MMLNKAKSKDGIALVIVLAFLTILILMAVLFVTLMRTERVASRNYMDIVRARHFVHTGMARALDDLAFVWPTTPPTDPAWPNRSFFSDQTQAENLDILTLGSGDLRSYFPYDDTTWGQVETAVNNGRVRWDLIEDPDDPNVILGRISYWIFECGGLLDAGVVHDEPTPRGTGLQPAEIRLSNLMADVQQPELLAETRSEFRRFASVAELLRLGKTVYEFPPQGDRQFLNTNANAASHFMNFSHFPRGYWDSAANALGQPIEIFDPATFDANAAQIENILRQPPYPFANVDEARVFMDIWRDYLDADKVQRNPNRNSIGTEAVAMLNEVRIRTIAQLVSSDGITDTLRNVMQLEVELWYPFSDFADEDFSLYRVEMEVLLPEPFTPLFQPNDEATLTRDIVAFPGDARFRRLVAPHHFRLERLFAGPAGAPVPYPASFRARLSVFRGADEVDRVEIDETWQSPNFYSVLSLPDPAPAIVDFYKEADDPRINWLWANPTHWAAGSGTMGSINAAASYAGKDESWEMHVADGDMLNTGEIGFLLYDEDKPWETVPLFGPDAWPVWTHFTAQNPWITRGLVNPKTAPQEVLAAVFHQTPPEVVPGAGATGLDWANSLAFAQDVRSVFDDAAAVNAGDVSLLTDAQMAISGLATRLEQKALLRNSMDLFSTRQQIFTIVVEAQALAPEIGNINSVQDHEILASQKALAVIWRDPYGQEPTITQYFKWLTD